MDDIETGRAAVLAGHGCDEDGPYLLVNDRVRNVQVRVSVRGRTFSLRRLPVRRCVGRHDLETHAKMPCPLDVELPPGSKVTVCPACQEATGFNPSFYHTDFVSPQQRAYNAEPHIAYLAYFSPAHVKAGITAASRGVRRLLEQGARAGRIVGRFDDAYAARELEAALCAQPGIAETMRASKKADLLANERFDAAEAVSVLDRETARLAQVEAVVRAGFAPEPVQDFSPYYFGGPSPSCDDLQQPDGARDVCGGRCIGMVGSAIVFEQGGASFVVCLKDWESHEVELVENEVLCTYDFAPQQMSLL